MIFYLKTLISSPLGLQQFFLNNFVIFFLACLGGSEIQILDLGQWTAN